MGAATLWASVRLLLCCRAALAETFVHVYKLLFATRSRGGVASGSGGRLSESASEDAHTLLDICFFIWYNAALLEIH